MGVANTIAKNSAQNFITTALNSLSVFVVGIVLARYFGTEQYGLYSLMIWLLSTAGLVADLGAGEMVKRFIAEATGKLDMNRVMGITRLVMLIRGSAAIMVALLIVALSSYLAKLFNIPTNHTSFILIAIASLFYSLTATVTGIFQGFQKYEYASLLELIKSPLRMVAIIILVLLGVGVDGVLLIYAIIYAIGLLVAVFILNRLMPIHQLLTPKPLDKSTRNSALLYCLAAMGILAVDYFLWGQGEVMFLGMFRTVEEVGIYNIANKIPILAIGLVPYVFGRVLMPAVAEQFGRGDMKKINQIYVTSARYLMILSFPLATGGIALAGPIISTLFGIKYASATIIMQIAFIPFAIRGLTHAVSSVIYGIKEPSFLVKVGIFLVVLSIGLNLWLIPKYGALGAVIATSIPRVITVPIYVRFVSKKTGAAWPMRDTLKTAIAAVIIGTAAFIIQHYLGNTLGLALGIPIGIIVYGVALLVIGAVTREDLHTFRALQKSLPKPLRKSYTGIMNLIQILIRQ
jgi:O-antigen/teichoic acid export membrane protein